MSRLSLYSHFSNMESEIAYSIAPELPLVFSDNAQTLFWGEKCDTKTEAYQFSPKLKITQLVIDSQTQSFPAEDDRRFNAMSLDKMLGDPKLSLCDVWVYYSGRIVAIFTDGEHIFQSNGFFGRIEALKAVLGTDRAIYKIESSEFTNGGIEARITEVKLGYARVISMDIDAGQDHATEMEVTEYTA